MEKEIESEKKNILYWILAKKAIIFISIGFLARVFMLFFYYYTHIIDPQKPWGDTGIYFQRDQTSPPLSVALLIIFRFLSFGRIEIFVFWSFFWDILTCIIFYFVLKSFDIKKRNYIYGLFLINPFYFLVNSFSLDNCGYHITDAFFLFFLLMAFIYYPKKQLYAKYLFYIFLALSMSTKYYTLPAIALFFIKYLYEQDWKELEISMICMVPVLIILLIIPLIFFDWFSVALFRWYNFGPEIPLFIRIIPVGITFILFIIFRLKKADGLEISIISTVLTALFMIFSIPYLRWFQALIFYGILKEKENILNIRFNNKEIKVDNHLLTFFLSIIAVILSYLFILYVHGFPFL